MEVLMDRLQIQSLVAGLCFGIWPLFLNKSHLNGYLAPMVLVVSTGIVATPFALSHLMNATQIDWWMVVWGGLFSVTGIMLYNFALMKATQVNISTLIVIQLVTQATVAAAYQVMVKGGMSVARMLGFMLAALAMSLLIKG